MTEVIETKIFNKETNLEQPTFVGVFKTKIFQNFVSFRRKIALFWFGFVSKSKQFCFVMRSKPKHERLDFPCDEHALHRSRIVQIERPFTTVKRTFEGGR